MNKKLLNYPEWKDIYINNISDEKIKLSLIKYFLEEDKEVWAYSTINKFKNEELILEGLKQLKSKFYKKSCRTKN